MCDVRLTYVCTWQSLHGNEFHLCLLVQGDTTEDIQQLFKGVSLPVRVDKIVRTMKQWREQAVQDRDQSDGGGETAKVEPDDDENGTKPEHGSGDTQLTDSGKEKDGTKVKSPPVVDVRATC